MKRIITLSILAWLIGTQTSGAQTAIDSLKPQHYFDFWIGNWDLTWKNADGEIQKGTNKIQRILGDKVIEENFEAVSGNLKSYKGKSYSVYNEKTGRWKQTWIDSDGAYLDFTGAFEDDRRLFVREAKLPDGNVQLQRMIFYDITKDSFNWNWEKSFDGGKTWELQWKISYRRVVE